ncbi:DUF2490 domain-containing protein [Sphingomonas sp. LT1P40]|uniref:DUF2490 domain-containing protein n=1 Tax=Alteristakelama amylovorans TaxID=3096166 RepID=UPI002FCB322E
MRSILLALPLALIAAPALAQEEDQELWLTGAASVGLGEDTAFEFDTVARWGNDPGGLYEVEINTLIAHKLTDSITIGGGYVRNINYSRGVVTRTEDRLRVQIGLSGAAGPVKLSGRVRLEHRNRSDGDEIGYRLRPQIKATLPLDETFSLIAHHESFIPLDDTDWGQRAGLERMRNFAGVAWQANDLLSFEVGYMSQYGFGRDGDRDVMDHALSAGFGLDF